MKRFAFRLQKVLDLRLYAEKEAQLRLAAKEGECLQLENYINDCLMRKAQAFLQRGSEGVQIQDLLAFEFFAKKMDQEAERSQTLLAQKILEREELQRAFVEARKHRKVLDNIRDRRRDQWKKERLKEEVKAMDDMNTKAYIRKLQDQEVHHG